MPVRSPIGSLVMVDVSGVKISQSGKCAETPPARSVLGNRLPVGTMLRRSPRGRARSRLRDASSSSRGSSVLMRIARALTVRNSAGGAGASGTGCRSQRAFRENEPARTAGIRSRRTCRRTRRVGVMQTAKCRLVHERRIVGAAGGIKSGMPAGHELPRRLQDLAT